MINKKAVAILGAILLLIIGTVGVLIYQRSGDTDIVEDTPPPPSIIVDTPPADEFPIEPPLEFPPIEPVPTIEPTPTPGGGGGGAVKLTEGEALSPVLFYQGNGIAYLNSYGQLFQVDLDETTGQPLVGNLQEVVIPQRAGITRVLWPDSGNNFIVERLDGPDIRFSVYVSDKGDYVDLPTQVKSVNWMPGGGQILYVWVDENGKSTLNIANPDNTGWQTITDFWEPDNTISVSPDGRNVAFYQTQNQTPPNKLNLVTVDGKIFKAVVREDFNLGASWSPNSKHIAFLRRADTGGKILWLVNIITGETKNLAVEVDSLDKMVWSQDSKWIYVGGISGVGATEQLLRIDSMSGTRQSVDLGSSSVDIREPFLNSIGTILFFRNVADGNKIYLVDVSKLGQ